MGVVFCVAVMPLFTHEAEEVPGMPDPGTPR